ncbi:coiled-coil domain-containing protein 158-like isoform X2 [Scyliorhinus canicula]|uniref:coiled-coil domain-containing protein 158-like isoform X2 n=1 Tax=Scyliorhinus canicula TaxID=7830 RepID=UPI0018F6CC7C|nr:coiled-coil domain-containing protein 158-like isoform X2 [Scyliorhinus canicula]
MPNVFETGAQKNTATCGSFTDGGSLSSPSPPHVSELPRSLDRARGRLSSTDHRPCQSSLHASEAGKEQLTLCKYISDSRRPSKNLEKLRKELERQTKETNILQEEVELATKLTMDKFNWNSNEGRSCSHDEFSTSPSDKSKSDRSFTATFPNVRSTFRSSLFQASISKVPRNKSPQTTKYDLDLVVSRNSIPSSGSPCMEKPMEDCANENIQCHEKPTFNIRRSVIDLQSKLQELQTERDNLMDLRFKESQNQGELICKLHNTVQDLETVNHMQDETVRDANIQIEQLRKKAYVYDTVVNEIRQALIHYEERTGKRIYDNENICNILAQKMGTAVDKILRDTDADISYLKERLAPMEEQLENLKTESQSKTEALLKQQEDRIEQLNHEHEQELSALTGKVNRSRSFATSFQNQVEAIQEQARNQSTMYSRQLTELETTVCHLRTELREAKRMYEDKIESLEKQVEQSQCEMYNCKREREESRQQVEGTNGRIQLLMADYCKVEEDLKVAKEQNQKLWERGTSVSISVESLKQELECKNQEILRLDGVINSLKEQYQHQLQCQTAVEAKRNEDQEKIKTVAKQYEICKEQLCKIGEELNQKKQQLDNAEITVCQLRESIKEKERCLENEAIEKSKLQHEIEEKCQKIHRMKVAEETICDQFEEAVTHLKKLQSDNDAVKMELNEKNKMLATLRQEMESISEMTSQQSCASEALQIERKQLQAEVDCQNQKIKELKNELDHKDAQMQELKAHLCELEKEKMKLVNSATDQMSELRDLLREKDVLSTELNLIQNQMGDLKDEYNNLQRSYTCKTEEYDWATNKLQNQLKSTQNDLEQTREAMKVLEGADTHAMKVAMGMQKQITAKRGQIDALQSKIQYLEEALENSEREKCYLKEEKVRLTKELACIVSERNKIAGEIDSLKSQEKNLKEKLIRLESALEKACLRFSDCQSVIQRQEQDFMRLKIQHALEVKAASRTSCLQEDLNPELKNILMELRNSACDGCNRPSSVNYTDCEGQRTSRNMHALDDLNTDSCTDRGSQDTCFRDRIMCTREIKEPFSTDNFACTADHSLQLGGPCYSSSPKHHSPSERSPVSSLLTGSLCEHRRETSVLDDLCPTRTTYMSAPYSENELHFQSADTDQTDAAGQACKKLQNKLDGLQNLVEDLQFKNHEMSSMIRNQEKRIKRVKDREKMLKK